MRLGKFFVTKETAIRIFVLIIALVNQFLVSFGLSPFPFSAQEIEVGLSWVFTVVAIIIAAYKNNDFTPEAHEGTELMRELKTKNKRGDE